jgi:PKD repeat protein
MPQILSLQKKTIHIGSKKNPTHVYDTKGSYLIGLRAHNGLKSDEKKMLITVTE